MRKIIRQGDIILREINEREISTSTLKEVPKVELSGETGNKHVIRPLSGRIMHDRLANVIVVTEEAEIVHPEHRRLTIPKGRWLIDRVRQWLGNRNGRAMD